MKIIDILNKIAKKEEIPIFEYEGRRYKYDYDDEMLYDIDDDERCKPEIYYEELNDEVKTINEIEHIDMFDNFTGYKWGNTDTDLLKYLEKNFIDLNSKINELVNEVNDLKREDK